MPKIAVIGAGVAGLAAAITLRHARPDAQVTIFERSDRAGGVLETIYDGPYLIERSADNFATMIPDALDLCKLTGYADQLISPQPNGRQAFVLNRGRVLPIPVGFSLVQPTRVWPILTTRTLSLSGKLRMLGEYFVSARTSTEDESLQSFATRRLGREAFENLVEPIVSGIFTADPSKLSMQATLPQFVAMERQHGGLIRGYLAARRQDAAAVARRASGARYDQFLAPKQGMSHFIQHLVNYLPTGTIAFQSDVQSVQPQGNQWQVLVNQQPQLFDGVIIAAPVEHAARCLSQAAPELANALSRIEYASSAVAVVIVDRQEVKGRVDGFGLIVPAREKRPVLAISYSSNKYAGRVPADQLMLRIFLGGAAHAQDLEKSDSQLMQLATEQLREILDWRGTQFHWQGLVRWNKAMPQYHLGHTAQVQSIMQQAAALGSLRLCGAGYTGVGIPQTVRSARQAAEELLSASGFSARSPNR